MIDSHPRLDSVTRSKALLAISLAALSSACARSGPQAARERACERAVLVLDAESEVHRRSELVGQLSTSCAKARDCARQLRARACELHADALILGPMRETGDPPPPALGQDGRPASRGNPAVPAPPGQKPLFHVQGGKAVRWLEPGKGAYAAQP